jgi:hypothetical protein
MPNQDDELLRLGSQYYVVGRCAALAGQLPVCGNLFHHAVEMMLKARLSQKCSAKELRAISHSLPKAWTKFKEEFPEAELSRFDNVIAELDPFERVRYPDNVIKEGAEMRIAWQRSHVMDSLISPVPRVPTYQVVVNDVDSLVAEIFKVSKRYPRGYINCYRPFGIDAIRQDNPVADFLLAP